LQGTILLVGSIASPDSQAITLPSGVERVALPEGLPLVSRLTEMGLNVLPVSDEAIHCDEADALLFLGEAAVTRALAHVASPLVQVERLPCLVVCSAADRPSPPPAPVIWEYLSEDASRQSLADVWLRTAMLRRLLRENDQLKDTNRAQREELARLVAVRTAQVRNTRQALELTEERLRSLAANVPGVLVQFEFSPDRPARFHYVSGRSEEMLGIPPEQCVQNPWGPLQEFHPDDREGFFRQVGISMDQGLGAVTWQGRFLGSAGRVRWFEISARLESKASSSWAALLIDITERKDLQAQVMQSDRLATLGILAAGVAHEINNPLTYMLNNLQLACQQTTTNAETPQLLAEALDGARRVRDIATNLRTFSRPAVNDAELVDLVAALHSSMRIAVNAVRFSARIVTELAPLPPVLGNPSRIGQVFLNLLINAAQAFDKPDSSQNLVRVRTYVDDLGDACVEVTDNGPGIPDALLPRIFDPFFSTKQHRDGTGLGLYICRDIVSSYRGTLTAESRPGAGATFRVRLPAAAVAPGQIAKSAPLAQPCTPRLSILVVDDEPMIGRSLKRLLARHDVTLAASGRNALELLRERDFDVVLCDLMMPGVDGVELYRTLNAMAHPARDNIIFMTGGAFTERTRNFLSSIKNPTLDKPVDLATLEQALVPFAHGAEERAAAGGAASTRAPGAAGTTDVAGAGPQSQAP
jgi:PAS domain S-box-containing protein